MRTNIVQWLKIIQTVSFYIAFCEAIYRIKDMYFKIQLQLFAKIHV